MSYKNFIQGEVGSLSDRRDSIEYDAGDWTRYIASFLNPFNDSSKFSREGMLAEAKKTAEKAINNSDNTLNSQNIIEQGLGGTNVNLSNLEIGETETAKEFNKRLAGLRAKAQAASVYAGTRGANLEKIDDSTSVQQINSLNTQQIEDNRQADIKQKNDERDKLWRRDTERQDDLLERQDIRQDRADARQDKRLAQDRRLTAETNQLQLQLQYAQLAQADRNRRQDRKDQAIMTIISGLGNLGAAFAI